METLLNLVWTSVSLALLLICGIHVARGGEDRRRSAAAVALLCLVCLLFPVISATDDINAGPALLVETNKSKRLAADAPAAMTLPSWPAVELPDGARWASFDRTSTLLPPSAHAFSYQLNRRPPPLPARAS